jgi:ankyrin repeat protein
MKNLYVKLLTLLFLVFCINTIAQEEKKLDQTIITGKEFKAERILSKGLVDINNHYAEHGDTPLLKSIRYRSFRMFKLFLKHGADPNIPNDNGETPVGLAASMFLDSYIDELMHLDIDIFVLDKKAKLYILRQTIVSGNFNKSYEILESFSIDELETHEVNELYYTISENGSTKLAQKIFEFKPEENKTNGAHQNVIHLLMMRPSLTESMLKLFIENEVDINVVDTNGYTPLDLALQRAHAEIISLMIDYNAKASFYQLNEELYNWLDGDQENYLKLEFGQSRENTSEVFVKRKRKKLFIKLIFKDGEKQITELIDSGPEKGSYKRTEYNKEGKPYYQEEKKFLNGECVESKSLRFTI